MERRDFLAGLASLPFLVGGRKLQDERPAADEKRAPNRPDALAQGLGQMKEWDLPGLVFVLPKLATERRALGRALLRIATATPYENGPAFRGAKKSIRWLGAVRQRKQARALSRTAVLICLEEDEAAIAWGKTAPRLVIDAESNVLRSLSREKLPVNVEQDVAPRLLALVHGPELERLRAYVAKLRATLDAQREREIVTLIEELAEAVPRSDDWKPSTVETDRLKRARELLAESPRLVSWFALALLDGLDTKYEYFEPQSLLFLLLGAQSESADDYPLGCYLPHFRFVGCGHHAEVNEEETRASRATVGCGMPSRSGMGGRYLRFAGDAELPKTKEDDR